MAKGIGLTEKGVQAAGVGKHHDGRGLYLTVRSATSRNWSLRYMVQGRAREVGLGSAFDVPLAEARLKAAELRAQVRKGGDPLADRLPAAEQRQRAANVSQTFEVVARAFLSDYAPKWSHPKHKEQWRRSLELYAFPAIGAKPVAEICSEDILTMLRPIWTAKAETARRVRMRVEKVLSAAIARGLRKGPNPAALKDNLEHLLAGRKKSDVQHLAAIPYPDMPGFMATIRERGGVASRCVEFLALTAVRSQEGAGAKLGEFDLAAAVWVAPAERMKLRKAHRVPLCPRAVSIVQELAADAEQRIDKDGGLLFPGLGTGKPLTQTALVKALRSTGRNETVHGLRSSFRDWAAEETHFQNHVVEMALAHAIGNDVEAAYRRGDLFEKRRELMEAWGTYCDDMKAATS